jgi:hypothetical protein
MYFIHKNLAFSPSVSPGNAEILLREGFLSHLSNVIFAHRFLLYSHLSRRHVTSVFETFPSASFVQREEHRLRVFENRVLRRIFGPKRKEVAGEDYIMRSFITCTLYQVKEDEVGAEFSRHVRYKNCIQNVCRETRKCETTRKT